MILLAAKEARAMKTKAPAKPEEEITGNPTTIAAIPIETHAKGSSSFSKGKCGQPTKASGLQYLTARKPAMAINSHETSSKPKNATHNTKNTQRYYCLVITKMGFLVFKPF